ncbi:(S)-8-oxocitronellyl enol synthase CYC2 [Henckelia pumila]|uniref:(S)-8-oxocitronellyl enol synthase CYC2 n=1 Tax=Henckelia pumila TaxID=405737 RepID=UPI003C6E2C54
MAVNDKRYRNVAAIFGVTGLVGKELARKLLSTRKWKVYGVARKRDICSSIMSMEGEANYHFISCDLLNTKETQEKLGRSNVLEDVTHIFWVTWASQFPLDTHECFDQNKAMLSNVLNAILPLSKGLKHFSIQTGVKHYVSLRGPASGGDQDRSYREDSPRVESGNGRNFYYGLEDLLQERLLGDIVTWSIQRPGLILGSSQRTLYNFIGSLCVYGAICKHLSLPFVFGGTKKCWEEMYIDLSDARLVADQHIWAATNQELILMKSSGSGIDQDRWEAFNAINGEGYTWMGMWRDIGIKFGLEVSEEDMFSEDFVYSSAMCDKGSVWNEIVVKEGLVDTNMEDLANWGFIDVLFRCPVKMLAAREKIDELGFKTKYQALDSISYWIDVMRADRLVP